MQKERQNVLPSTLGGHAFGVALCVLMMMISGHTFNSEEPQPLPVAPHVQVFDVTPYPGLFNEPSIAINPRNPLQVAAVFQNNVTIAYSEDAGQHWSLVNGAPPNYKVSGDVSIAYDKRGHAIVAYIAFDGHGTSPYWAHNATRNGIFVRRSLDGGKTWEHDQIPVIENETKPHIPWEDKPYIVADKTDGPYGGSLYIGWTEYREIESVILFSRSTDGGQHWSPPIEISTLKGVPRGGGGAVIGFTGAVAADGTVYGVWAHDDGIEFTSSTDGGRTFTASRKVLGGTPLTFQVADANGNGFPQVGVDQHDGRVYITWGDARNGDIDIFCSTSTDKGRTWGPAVRVNNDPVRDGIDQFMQWLAVDPKTGAAYVVLYDRRNDANNKKITIVLARSTDGGKTFANYAWTQTPFEAKGRLGDYTGIAAFEDRVYGAWAERNVEDWKKAWGKTGLTAEYVSVPDGTCLRIGIADFSK